MLARSAESLYWMGRYLERAERLCRLLQLQSEALVDRPLQEIHFGWQRIYLSIGREPPGGTARFQTDDFVLADSYTLADDLAFEPSNPDAVWNCFAQGRENARHTRHCISGEMWTQLNMAYLAIQPVGIADIWRASPESFFAATAEKINTFDGVAESTMYRDDGWRFMQLGRYIERAQLSAALLLSQISLMDADYGDDDTNGDADADVVPDAESAWASLLRINRALEAYVRQHGVTVQPEPVIDLLGTDPLLPDSLYRSLEIAAAQVTEITPGPNPEANIAVRRAVGRLCALLLYVWPEETNRTALLERVRYLCRELHQQVVNAWFEYSNAGLLRGDGAPYRPYRQYQRQHQAPGWQWSRN